MIVSDESAPLDPGRPPVSVTVCANGRETVVMGDAAIVAIVDEGGVGCLSAGEADARSLAALGLAADRTAEKAAYEMEAGADYHMERIRLIVGNMDWRAVDSAAD